MDKDLFLIGGDISALVVLVVTCGSTRPSCPYSNSFMSTVEVVLEVTRPREFLVEELKRLVEELKSCHDLFFKKFTATKEESLDVCS